MSSSSSDFTIPENKKWLHSLRLQYKKGSEIAIADPPFENLADLSLLSRRAWIQAIVNQKKRARIPGLQPKRLKSLRKKNPTSKSAPSLRKLNKDCPDRKSSNTKSTTALPSTTSPPQTFNHATTLIAITHLSDLASSTDIAASQRATKLAHLPTQIAMLDQVLKLQNDGSPMFLTATDRQSSKLCQRLSDQVKKRIQQNYHQGQPHTSIVALRKNIRLDMSDAHRWNVLLRKEMKSSLKQHILIHRQRQQKWLTIVSHVVWINSHQRTWNSMLHQRRIEKDRHEAIAKLQVGWKTSYSKRMDAKHARTYELLKRRAWVARLNVRTRQRGRNGSIVRRFLMQYADSSRFLQCIRLYRWRIIRIQQATRRYFKIRQARLRSLLILWSKSEPTVLIDMEIDKRKEEKEMEKRKQLRRMSVEMNMDITQLQAQMEAMEAKDKKKKEQQAQEQQGSTLSPTLSSTLSPLVKKRQRPKSAAPVNVKWAREARHQALVLSRCQKINQVLAEREELILADTSTRMKGSGSEWNNVHKNRKKNKKVRPQSSHGTQRRRMKTTMAPGMRMSTSNATMGPFQVAQQQMHAKQQQQRLRMKQAKREQEQLKRAKKKGGSANRTKKQARLGVVSRYAPLCNSIKRRVVLDWLSELMRHTFKAYDKHCAHVELAPSPKLSVEEMKQIMNETTTDAGGNQGGTSSALAQTFAEKPKPDYFFPLFSQYATKEELVMLIKRGHEKNEQMKKGKEDGAKKRSLKKIGQLEKGKTPVAMGNVKSATLRHLLGDELIGQLGDFIDTMA